MTGKTLIDWGIDPKGKGKWFGEALKEAQYRESCGHTHSEILLHLERSQPKLPPEIALRTNALPFEIYVEPESEVEQENLNGVIQTMDALLRVPTAVAGAVLPDAMGAGPGSIPVGCVIAAKDAIHPGWHSADVCCSMAITVFKRKDDLKKILDAAQAITHFGPGGREKGWLMPATVAHDFSKNRFLSDAGAIGDSNLGTQGDGNHFLYVGTLRSTGQPALVTHHGSRGVGALLHKRGMAVAKKHTAIHSPRTPEKAAWIDANGEDGLAYWEALQIARRWTKWNHFLLHGAIQQAIGNRIEDQFWNEHNFVFRRDDGLYYHAKGATPSFKGFSDDDDGRTLIPMNMCEPILITTHRDKPEALGFSPHGAGRNMTRTQHVRNLTAARENVDPRGLSPRDIEEIFREETRHIDVRSYLGRPDLSELPSAYKSAEQVQRQIKKHGLADVVDYVDPYGCIMAGEIVWNKRKKEKTGVVQS
nr:RtcB family protein [Mesorhizobium sp.]